MTLRFYNMHMYSKTISLLHKLNMNDTQFFLLGEGEDFQLADSSTDTTTVIWDTLLSYIEWSKQTIFAKTLYLHYIFTHLKVFFFKLEDT